MGSVTSVKSIPFAVGTDPSDPRFIRDLAVSQDTAFASYDAAFTAGPRPAAFMLRSTADASSFGGCTTCTGTALQSPTVEWDTSGGTVNGSTWTQNTAEVWSWWMFGLMIITNLVSGVPTSGTPLRAIFSVASVDPVSGVGLGDVGDGQTFYSAITAFPNDQTEFSTESPETNTTHDYLAGYIIVPIYRGSVFPEFGNSDTNGSAVKLSATGSVFWGLRLGAV